MRELTTIDCRYLHPEYAASYLVCDNGRALFVEANTSKAVPHLLEALQARGLRPDDVDYIIVTHAHLDHAGGCGSLAAACPNARVLAHPRAATHLIAPQRLEDGARKVYGDAEFERLYGRIEPLDAQRVRSMEDGETVTWQGATLRFLHTLGHANHHMCIHDEGLDAVFTGDSFGIAYPALQEKGLFIFPSTSPTNFQPREALETVDRLAGLGVGRAMLTHYGAISDLATAAIQLRSDLELAQGLMREGVAASQSEAELTRVLCQRLEAHFAARLTKLGFTWDEALRTLLRLDIELNAAGIAHSAVRQRLQGNPSR